MMIRQTVFQGWATARPFLFFDLRAKTIRIGCMVPKYYGIDFGTGSGFSVIEPVRQKAVKVLEL